MPCWLAVAVCAQPLSRMPCARALTAAAVSVQAAAAAASVEVELGVARPDEEPAADGEGAAIGAEEGSARGGIARDA